MLIVFCSPEPGGRPPKPDAPHIMHRYATAGGAAEESLPCLVASVADALIDATADALELDADSIEAEGRARVAGATREADQMQRSRAGARCVLSAHTQVWLITEPGQPGSAPVLMIDAPQGLRPLAVGWRDALMRTYRGMLEAPDGAITVPREAAAALATLAPAAPKRPAAPAASPRPAAPPAPAQHDDWEDALLDDLLDDDEAPAPPPAAPPLSAATQAAIDRKHTRSPRRK